MHARIFMLRTVVLYFCGIASYIVKMARRPFYEGNEAEIFVGLFGEQKGILGRGLKNKRVEQRSSVVQG